ncbi:fasciclin-like arabinogalactan family protein [Wolffia australiana]
MDLSRHLLKMGYFSAILLVYMCLLFIWSLLFLPNAHLPELQRNGENTDEPIDSSKLEKSREKRLGELGEMMISMLPVDLPFTVFVPSERAFQSVLQLNSDDCLLGPKVNETVAILSHVMGFSTVPWRVASGEVPKWRKEVQLYSVSGFRLHARRDPDGTLVVNGVPANSTDIARGLITVHIMNGVLMDAEFEQSFHPSDED